MDSGHSIQYLQVRSADDIRSRLNAIYTTSQAQGPGCQEELMLLFLHGHANGDARYEILMTLTNELGRNFDEYVGGKEHVHLLLRPLEALAEVEDKAIRDQAANSIAKIAAVLSDEKIEQDYVPLVKRMSQGEWYTSRAASTALYPAAYIRVPPEIQDELRKSYLALGKDEMPMVRRDVAETLTSLLGLFAPRHLLSDGLSMYGRLRSDDQELVRLLAVENLVAIAKRLSPPEVKKHLLPQIEQVAGDRSWRVRKSFVARFGELAAAIGDESVWEILVTLFLNLLEDADAEVRRAARNQIHDFSGHLEKEVILARLLPSARRTNPGVEEISFTAWLAALEVEVPLK